MDPLSEQGDPMPRDFTICTRCWLVIGIDGQSNPDRAITVCSHLGPVVQAKEQLPGRINTR